MKSIFILGYLLLFVSTEQVEEVLHACYSKVSPSLEVENPELVAWSESVGELLDLDPKEFERPDFPLFFSGALPLKGGSYVNNVAYYPRRILFNSMLLDVIV